MTVVYMVLVLGVSTIFWTLVGLTRAVGEEVGQYRAAVLPPGFAGRRRWLAGSGSGRPGSRYFPSVPSRSRALRIQRAQRRQARAARVEPADVAVLVAAHNEALVIGDTIRAAANLVPLRNIHVVSDMSSDETADIARKAGAQVLELDRNRGKAGALAAGIAHFELCRDFKVVMLLDADTRPAADYLATGLPLFADPTVAAVAGRARSILTPEPPTAFGRFLVMYRERLYIVVQLLLKYGQAAKGANVVSIVPGFASMYRTKALEQVDVLAPGLVIEDFNMTFELHAKKLGRIAFHPSAAVAYTQDPDTLRDYVNQMRRWVLGFGQTVRRHRVQAGKFWFALAVYVVELVVSCIFFVLLIPLLVVSIIAAVQLQGGNTAPEVVAVAGLIRPQDVLLGVFLPDLLLTVMAAVSLRRPAILLMAPFFPLMRIVDSGICLMVLPRGFASHSTGVWTSPPRRAQQQAQTAEAIPG